MFINYIFIRNIDNAKKPVTSLCHFMYFSLQRRWQKIMLYIKWSKRNSNFKIYNQFNNVYRDKFLNMATFLPPFFFVTTFTSITSPFPCIFFIICSPYKLALKLNKWICDIFTNQYIIKWVYYVPSQKPPKTHKHCTLHKLRTIGNTIDKQTYLVTLSYKKKLYYCCT